MHKITVAWARESAAEEGHVLGFQGLANRVYGESIVNRNVWN